MNVLRLIKTVAKIVPIVGNMFRNKDSKDGGEGKFDWKKLGADIIDLGSAVAIGYFL